MSEHNYAGLFFRQNLKDRPQDFIITDEQIAANEKLQAARRAQQEKAAPPPAKPDLRKEYNDLRKQLYDLQQNAKYREIDVNNEASSVHHFETLVSDLLTKKKAATTDNRLGDERNYEHQLVRAEEDLQDARERLVKKQRDNKAAVRGLREFNRHERLQELKTELGL